MLASNQLKVALDSANQRIDNFLMKHFKTLPKARIYKAIRKGEIRVDSKRINPMAKLIVGQIVRVPPFMVSNESTPPVFRISDAAKATLEQAVLYEDESILILNKPAGWAAHGGTGAKLGIIEALNTMNKRDEPLYLVHRLDKGTSGCMLIAKSRPILTQLHELMRKNQIQKTYECLVVGRWPHDLTDLTAPLLRQTNHSHQKMIVSSAGKSAHTKILSFQNLKGTGLTKLTIQLETGRMHQIRVHCADAGRPILGDERYGNIDANKRFEAQGITGLQLHASTLSVPGLSRKPMLFHAPWENPLG